MICFITFIEIQCCYFIVFFIFCASIFIDVVVMSIWDLEEDLKKKILYEMYCLSNIYISIVSFDVDVYILNINDALLFISILIIMGLF